MLVTTYSPVNYNRINYTPQIYARTKSNHTDTVSFSERQLTKEERKMTGLELEEKMKTRPESVQELYQYGIDFLNKKISIQQYLNNMRNLLEVNYGKWGGVNRQECRFIGSYGLNFDECLDAETITSEDIFNKLNALLGH